MFDKSLLLSSPLPARTSTQSGQIAAVAAKPAFDLPWSDASMSERLGAAAPAEKPGPPVDKEKPRGAPSKKRESARSALARSGSLLPELSAVTSGAKLTGEESLLRERLAAKVAAMRKLDYFEILGLPTTATREDVKRAYFALAKEF